MNMLVNKQDPQLYRICDFSNLPISTYKHLKKGLKEAFNRCPNAVAIASNQVMPFGIDDAPMGIAAAFLFHNKLYINPSYKPLHSAGYMDHVEGCLSSPGTVHQTRRWNALLTSYQLIKGHRLERYTRIISGFEAQVFQHEIDHLNGITIF